MDEKILELLKELQEKGINTENVDLDNMKEISQDEFEERLLTLLAGQRVPYLKLCLQELMTEASFAGDVKLYAEKLADDDFYAEVANRYNSEVAYTQALATNIQIIRRYFKAKKKAGDKKIEEYVFYEDKDGMPSLMDLDTIKQYKELKDQIKEKSGLYI